MTDESLPLSGVTVVSLEQAVAAPLATRHLADLGARVIKIERPGRGDFARDYDTAVHGLGSHFVWLNRSKESIAVDLKTTRGRDIVLSLIGRADVFLQNLAPGAAERLGFGAQALRRERDDLIVVDMSGYGDAGPYRDRKAYDMLVQAESGLISITGTPEAPAKTGIPSADIAAGMYAYSGVLGALFRRERTGHGAHLKVSMFDSLIEWLGHPMYLTMYTGKPVPRMGVGHPSIAPYDAYPTSDGEMLIAIQNDRGWRTLAEEVFGCPDLAADERFATNVLRVRHRTEVDAAVAEQTRRFTSADLGDRLAASGVAAAQLNDVAGMLDHPQLADRDRWRTVDTEAGPIRALLPPIGFDDVEPTLGSVPTLGEHTDTILTELGMTGEQIAGLRDAAVVQ